MVDKICNKVMDRIRLKMPEVDDERAEVIRYGLELAVGEVPKLFLIFAIAVVLGVTKYFLISSVIVCLYRTFSGGVHLRSHIGCIIGTTFLYLGNVYISIFLKFPNFISRLVFSIFVFVFSIIMITLYAPADTDNVPILRKKERRNKRICSYIVVTFYIMSSFFIKDRVISNMCVVGVLLQSLTISKFIYDIFKVKLGYLEYIKNEKNAL